MTDACAEGISDEHYRLEGKSAALHCAPCEISVEIRQSLSLI